MNDALIKPLKEGRRKVKMTQGEVAKEIGITVSTLGNYERGYTEPDIDTYIRLCKLYGLDFYAIVESAYGLSGFTPKEVALVKKYRVLNKREKDVVDSAMRFITYER